MLGFCVLLKDTHLVESNRESGYGRFDLALLPVNEKYYGVILEFKRADDEAHLEAKALEALAQIDELLAENGGVVHGKKDFYWRAGFCDSAGK